MPSPAPDLTDRHDAVGIRIAGIGKSFDGGAAALDDVSLDIRPGELVALLGPSGSGKTTLLRVIAGLEIPTTGQVFFGGEDATRLAVQDRQVGFVFQHYALFKHMSVADNIAYGLSVRPSARRPSAQAIRTRVEDLLDLVQLSGLGGRYPAQLSGGQRQRVALARALAVEPRVLLLDEPFGALDAKVRRDLRRWLRDIHRQTGHTTVFVTHDQDEALELADRVAILNKGRVEQIDTPDAVYDDPTSAFVMSFVGDTNTIPVEVRSGRVILGGQPLDVDAAGLADGPASLLARPNELVLTNGECWGLKGRIVHIRRTASGRRVEVELTGGAVVELEAPSQKPLALGDAVGVHIVKALLFPGSTGTAS